VHLDRSLNSPRVCVAGESLESSKKMSAVEAKKGGGDVFGVSQDSPKLQVY